MNSEQKKRSWSDLVHAAREVMPPEGIDVRDDILFAIQSERRTSPPPTTGLLDELAELFRSGWMRGALAALALTTGAVAWQGANAAAQFAFALDLQGMLLAPL